jgi:peptidoglycan/LPS O-acetylase OafA/YrhL
MASTARPRLEFLDALRGIAVALVLVQHVGEQVSPAIRSLGAHGVQLGQLGVMIFFLCSGFIIPASLERSGNGTWAGLRSFWRSRFLRLYPMYWVSLAGALLLTTLGRPLTEPAPTAGEWAANTTMLQAFFGAPNAIGLYWTLTLEMVFYLAVSVLFLLGWHRRSVVLSLVASGACLAGALLAEPVLGRGLPLVAFNLATMFAGTVFFRWYSGAVRLRTLLGTVLVALAAGSVLLVTTLGVHAPAGDLGPRTLGPMLTAWLGAYAVFAVALTLRGRRFPAALRRLGAISFSVYLVHALVLAAVPALASSVATAIVWVAVVLAVSECTYRYVEQPAIRLGRRLGSRRTGAPVTPAAVPGEGPTAQRDLVAA